MMLHRSVALVGAVLFTSAVCAQPAPERKPFDTRVAWQADCPNGPKPPPPKDGVRALGLGAALFSVIGPKLIGGAIDSAAEALKAAGNDRDSKSVARTGNDFYKVTTQADVSPAVGCLLVLRGEFTNEATPFTWAKNSDELNGLQKPIFHLEAKMVPLKGGKFFQLQPVYLKVSDFEEFSFSDPKDRDYVVAMSLKLPGLADPFGSAEFLFTGVERGTELKDDAPKLRMALSRPISFPSESADAVKAKSKLEGLLAPYLLAQDILKKPPPRTIPKIPPLREGPGVSSAAETFCGALRTHNGKTPRQFALTDERCAYVLEHPREMMEQMLEEAHRSPERTKWANGVCNLKMEEGEKEPACANLQGDPDVKKARLALASSTFTFYTTDITLTETREGSKLALYLGNALSSSKDGLTEVVSAKLLPKQKQQADAEATEVRTSVLVANLEVTKAEEALAEVNAKEGRTASEVTDARIVLLKAKIAANKAYRAAGQSMPYPEID